MSSPPPQVPWGSAPRLGPFALVAALLIAVLATALFLLYRGEGPGGGGSDIVASPAGGEPPPGARGAAPGAGEGAPGSAGQPGAAPPGALGTSKTAVKPLVPSQAAGLVREADAALASDDLDAAARLYDEALKIDPKNAQALAGKLGLASLKRRFVFDRTAVESRRAAGKDLAGFDLKGSTGVEVKRAPEVSGRLEFAVEPRRVKPGDAYTVKVFFINEGKETIKIKDVTVATILDGKRTDEAVSPKVREVASFQNEMIAELRGNWKPGVDSWVMAFEVTSTRDDVYRSQLSWK